MFNPEGMKGFKKLDESVVAPEAAVDTAAFDAQIAALMKKEEGLPEMELEM